MAKTHELSATQEDYLEAILVLTKRQGAARVRDIANELSVHKSTVTAALKALSEKDLVNYAPYEFATLTESGRNVAERVERDHVSIRAFLSDVLELDAEIAEANACRMEHVMDRAVLDKLKLLQRRLLQAPPEVRTWLRGETWIR